MANASIARTLGSIAILSTIALSGCATGPTPYQPAEGRHGYVSEDLSDTIVQVTFRGNVETSEEEVEAALFRRMVDIADSREAETFTVVDEKTDCVTTLRTSPITTCTYRQSADALFQYNFGVYEIESLWHDSPQREYEATATIDLTPTADCAATANCHVTSEALASLSTPPS